MKFVRIHVDARSSLLGRALSGSVWIMLLQAVILSLGFVRGIVLARLLSPAAFGLFGMIYPLYLGLQAISNVGLAAALIHRKLIERADLDAAWTLQSLRGLILTLTMVILSPLAANFFAEPLVRPLMVAMALAPLVHGIASMGMVILQKEMDFRAISTVQMAAAVAEFLVAFAVAYWLRTVWAFVAAAIAGAAVTTVGSYLVHPYRPKLSSDWARMRSLMNYGKWILTGQAVVFGATEGDDILVGRLLGATPLGFYRMSYYVSNLPATQITNVISQVTLPMFSEAKDDPELLRKSFLTTLSLVSSATLPLCTGLVILAPNIVDVLLGEEWMPIVPLIRLLTIWGVLRSVGSLTAPLFQAIGEPKMVTLVTSIQLLCTFLFILFLYPKFQLHGVAYAVVAAGLVQVPYALYLAKSRIHFSLLHFVKAIKLGVTATIIMAVFVIWLHGLIQAKVTVPGLLLLSIVSGAVVYFSVLLLQLAPRGLSFIRNESVLDVGLDPGEQNEN